MRRIYYGSIFRRRCRLSKAQLKGTDLRGANLDGIDFKSLDVNGARMDISQAVAFLRSYGAKVEW